MNLKIHILYRMKKISNAINFIIQHYIQLIFANNSNFINKRKNGKEEKQYNNIKIILIYIFIDKINIKYNFGDSF